MTLVDPTLSPVDASHDAARGASLDASVVVIEDDESIAELVLLAMQSAGWRATAASTVAEGLRRVALEQPDVVLLDLTLPDRSGLEALALLKGDETTAGTPVVVMTASSSREAWLAAREAGAQDVIAKPFDNPDLVARMKAARRVAVERRRADDALRQLRLLADSVSDVVVRIGLDGIVLSVSDSVTAVLGWQPSEVLGISRDVAMHPDDLPHNLAQRDEVIANPGTSYRCEFRLRHKDGRWVWCETNRVLIIDPVTGEASILNTIRDISERRAAEDRFRSTFEEAPIGMGLVGTDGRWVRVNRALCAMLGYDAETLLELTFQDITHPEDLATDLGLMAEVLAGRRDGYEMVKRYFDADGRIVWVQLNVSLVHDPDGEPLHFVSQIQDITARRAATTALEASESRLQKVNGTLRAAESRYRQAMAAAPIGIMDVDTHGICIEVNDALCRLMGRSRAELVGSGPADRGDAAEPGVEDGMYARVRSGALRQWSGQRRFERSDGVAWVETHSVVIDDPAGAPERVITYVADITDHVERSASLAAQAATDPLTGLLNRVAFTEELDRRLADREPVGVLFIDLDDFKAINDTHGHDTGDRVLVTMADRLRQTVRPGDVIGRLGGDEIVVVAEAAPWQLEQLAQRVRDHIREPTELRGQTLEIRASVGVAVGNEGDSAVTLLQRADVDMYTKKPGRGASLGSATNASD